jgi:hypothetical protein
LALLWKAAGLYSGRAYREGDPSYESKFHRYSDLILTAVAEPWVRCSRSGVALLGKKMLSKLACVPWRGVAIRHAFGLSNHRASRVAQWLHKVPTIAENGIGDQRGEALNQLF